VIVFIIAFALAIGFILYGGCLLRIINAVSAQTKYMTQTVKVSLIYNDYDYDNRTDESV
jgi:hypothetical protein